MYIEYILQNKNYIYYLCTCVERERGGELKVLICIKFVSENIKILLRELCNFIEFS